jgi:hypothetical protein
MSSSAGSPTRVNFEMLKPCEVKVSRTVLRGKGAEKPPTYPIMKEDYGYVFCNAAI